MPHLFDPLTLRGVTLRNRVMMSPMCQYSAGADGQATDWHLVHYGSRAVGGAALVMIEATSIESRGRISARDLGIWDDSQIEPLARIVRFCHEYGAKVGLQIAHAGRKAWSSNKGHGPDSIVGPSAAPFDADWQTPSALTVQEIGDVVASFGAAARRAREAGFDLVEIHGAHGYLIAQFLSLLANRREDGYGGGHEGRARFLVDVIDAVRAELSAETPVFLRLSCTEYVEGGNGPADAVVFSRIAREHGVDLIDCSSGGAASSGIGPIGSTPGYQVPHAERIRREVGIPTGAVGVITEPDQADGILDAGQADLIVLGRALLRAPYWPLRAAQTLGVDVDWPTQYGRVKPSR